MEGRIKRWGNSYGVRLTKADLERLGLAEGDPVEISLRKPARARSGKVRLPPIPTVRDDDPHASERHDQYLYGERP